MDINFNGYLENVLTLACDDSVQAGDLVSMSGSGTVGKTAEGNSFVGLCLNTAEGYAAVQLNGYVEIEAAGTVSVGYTKLVAGASGVKTGSSGKERLVLFNEGDKVGFIL